jgi:hypothetical protein
MRFRPAVVLAVLWTLCGAALAPAQFGITFRYTCASGRFRVSYGKNVWHYCYDGKYYNEKTLPADIRAYFERVAREHKEAMEKFHRDFAEAKQKSAEHWAAVDADRLAKGFPTLAEQREMNTQRMAERRAGKLGPPAGGAVMLHPSMARGGGVEASAKPEAEPVTPEALKGIAAGTSAADLIAALGEPPGKVATGEGVESWTYVLTTGAFAKVKLEASTVKEVVVPN